MNLKLLEAGAAVVSKRLGHPHPRCGIVLGSGLGHACSIFDRKAELAFEDIPSLGTPGIDGHAGRILLLEHAGVECIAFCGRRHWYEGQGWEPVAAPIHIMKTLGVDVVVLTNAAGAIADGLLPGDIMQITDHLNCMGSNPLIGPVMPFFGPRFPDQSMVYNEELRSELSAAADEQGVDLKSGVYAAVAGPCYETPAEIHALRSLGADAVGMSTVPEAMLASAAGLRVAGLSCIVNRAAGYEPGANLCHSDVTSVASSSAPKVLRLLQSFIEGLK